MNKEKFWTINVGHILSIVVVVMGLAVQWGSNKSQVESLNKRLQIVEDTQKELRKDIAIANMTAVSLSNLDSRIVAVERYIPEIVKISTTLDFIKSHLLKESKP